MLPSVPQRFRLPGRSDGPFHALRLLDCLSRQIDLPIALRQERRLLVGMAHNKSNYFKQNSRQAGKMRFSTSLLYRGSMCFRPGGSQPPIVKALNIWQIVKVRQDEAASPAAGVARASRLRGPRRPRLGLQLRHATGISRLLLALHQEPRLSVGLPHNKSNYFQQNSRQAGKTPFSTSLLYRGSMRFRPGGSQPPTLKVLNHV